jgi:hypothetical protein
MKVEFSLAKLTAIAFVLISLLVVVSSVVMAVFTPSTDGQARLTDENPGLYVIDLAGGYLYNSTLNETTAGGDINMSGYTLRNVLLEDANQSSDIDANGYRVENVVLNNVTFLSPELRTTFFDFRQNRINNISQIHGTTQLVLHGAKQADQDKSDATILLQNGSVGGRIYFYTPDGANTGLIQRIMVEGVSDSYVYTQFNTTVRPWTNNTVDLGTSALKWKAIYAVTTDFGDIIIDDQVVLRASGDKLSFYSYDSQTKQLIEKVMELNLLTGDLKLRGHLYENIQFQPLTKEEKRVGG